jgi:hypothetical protein
MVDSELSSAQIPTQGSASTSLSGPYVGRTLEYEAHTVDGAAEPDRSNSIMNDDDDLSYSWGLEGKSVDNSLVSESR